MKSEKGITLTSLILYIILLLLVVSILSVVSSYFKNNVNYITDIGKYVTQFNKFNCFFIEDVKNNSELLSVEENKIVFKDGTTYTFANNDVYRNKVRICENLYALTFEEDNYEDNNGFTKKIITVHMAIEGSNLFESTNEYVLKYW